MRTICPSVTVPGTLDLCWDVNLHASRMTCEPCTHHHHQVRASLSAVRKMAGNCFVKLNCFHTRWPRETRTQHRATFGIRSRTSAQQEQDLRHHSQPLRIASARVGARQYPNCSVQSKQFDPNNFNYGARMEERRQVFCSSINSSVLSRRVATPTAPGTAPSKA